MTFNQSNPPKCLHLLTLLLSVNTTTGGQREAVFECSHEDAPCNSNIVTACTLGKMAVGSSAAPLLTRS